MTNDRFYLNVFLTLLICICATRAHSQVQIVEFSDSHSTYERLALFLRNFDQVSSDYLAGEPSGKIVVVVNGDFGGFSSSSDEDGWFGIRTLAELAKVATVVYTPGNHDAFDWGLVGYGNKLMNRQLAFLKNSGVHILSRNYRLDTDVTEPYFDLQMASGRRVRFAGFGLQEIFKKSPIQVDVSPKVILSTNAIASSMLEVAEEAIRDRVENLVFFQHDGQAALRANIKALDTALGSELHRGGVNIPVAFAGHDHLRAQEVLGETLLVDSRSNFDCSVIQLGADGERKTARFYDQAAQRANLRNGRTPRYLRLEKMAQAIDKRIEKQKLLAGETLGRTGGFSDIKVNLKQGRAELGTVLADSLKAWGRANRPHGLDVGFPVVAFYNSSSYRRDDVIPPGPLVFGTVKTFYPFPGDARLFLASGEEINKLFAALRTWRLAEDGMYTPQMPRELSEVRPGENEFALSFNGQLLRKEDRYLVVLDSWLARNGYQIAEFTEFLKSHQPLAKQDMTAIFKSFAPQELMGASPDYACRDLFKMAPLSVDKKTVSGR